MPSMMERLQGQRDSRGMAGIAARGANVYNGGTNNAGRAGGRPSTGQINPLTVTRYLNRDPNNPGAEMSQPNTVNGLPGGQGAVPPDSMVPVRASTNPSSQQMAAQRRQSTQRGQQPMPPAMMMQLPMLMANLPMNMQAAAIRRLRG